MKEFELLNKGLLTVVILIVSMMVCGAGPGFSATVNNPMTEDLDADTYDISDVGTLGVADIIAEGPWVDARAYGSFSAAVDAAGNKTLLVSNTQAVTANKTVPSNVTLKFLQSGSLNISNGVVVTINGPLDAGLHQVFEGAGTVEFGDGAVVEIYPQWWGASPSASASTNSAAFLAAIDASHAESTSVSGIPIKIPRGYYNYDATIGVWGDAGASFGGLILIGSGTGNTILNYTGSDEAIEIYNINSSKKYGVQLSNFSVVGNANADMGIKIWNGAGYNYGMLLDRLRVTGFTQENAYALYLHKGHLARINDCWLDNSYNGVFITGETMSYIFNNCKVSYFTDYGYYLDHVYVWATINGGEISNATVGECTGILVNCGKLKVNGVHLEDLNCGIDVSANGTVKADQMYVVGNIASVCEDVVDSGIESSVFTDSRLANLEAGIGTRWTNCWGAISVPDYVLASAAIEYRLGTVTNMSAAQSQICRGFGAAAGKVSGPITMNFTDDDITLYHNQTAYCTGVFILKDGLAWNPHSGDSITFKYAGEVGGKYQHVEINRVFNSKRVAKTANFDVIPGDHGRTFMGTTSSGTITASMFDCNASTVGTVITFYKASSANELRIDPCGNEYIVGSGGVGKYLALESNGATVTLQQVSDTAWAITSIQGTYSFE